jgi:acyl-CoA thioesterase FadM
MPGSARGLIGRRNLGLPVATLRYAFAEPARQGDALCLRLSVVRLGRPSFTISIEGEVGGRLKLRAEQVLVTTSLATEHAIDIPDDLRAALEVFGVTGSTNPQTPATRIRFAVKSLRWRTC